MARVALVTGGGTGIGRATALRLARDGLDVAVNFLRSEAAARATVEAIRSLGRRAVGLRADVADAGAAARLVDAVVGELGGLDVLVNNAGIYRRASFEELTLEQWNRTLAVDLTGVFHCCRAALPALRASRSGRIVNVASQLALRGADRGVDYGAAKAGVLGLTRCLALELAPLGITVNAVAPGTIETDLIAHYTEEERARRRARIPLGRIGDPAEVAAAIAFLASEEASYVTGATLLVAGGGLIA